MLITEDLGGSRDRTRVDDGFWAVFDRLSEQGSSAVMTGMHQQDSSPVTGGRWGLSVVAALEDRTQQQLTAWSEEIRLVAGQEHWPTGAHGSAHVTVRAIQPHRPGLDVSDPLAARCGQAILRAASCLDGRVVLCLQSNRYSQ